ncbi:hypothetical protein [Phycicoccus avicenniae]|uniref:hypothetical protein n=1 Tax=Phycicoccus avicenniae TaxID=2828860 RepID=UPI003D28E1B0
MDTTQSTNGMPAMAAARTTLLDAVWYGSTTAHAVDRGRVQGRTVSAAAFGAREAVVAGVKTGIATAPSTGDVRLEGPPV